MSKTFSGCIMATRAGTLCGVTDDLARLVYEHKRGLVHGFTEPQRGKGRKIAPCGARSLHCGRDDSKREGPWSSSPDHRDAAILEILTRNAKLFLHASLDRRGDHRADGYRTFHGMMSRGFPNQFFTGFTQAGVSANTTSMFEQQGSHIAYIIRETMPNRLHLRRDLKSAGKDDAVDLPW